MIADTTLSDAEQGANRRATIAEGRLEPSRPFCPEIRYVTPKWSTHGGKRKRCPDAATSRQASDASGAAKTRQTDPRNVSDEHLADATTNRPRVAAPNVVPKATSKPQQRSWMSNFIGRPPKDFSDAMSRPAPGLRQAAVQHRYYPTVAAYFIKQHYGPAGCKNLTADVCAHVWSNVSKTNNASFGSTTTMYVGLDGLISTPPAQAQHSTVLNETR